MIDLAAELLAALRSPEGRALLLDVVREGVRAALAAQGEPLQPLSEILSCSADAARMRLLRDPELAALSIVVGNRRLFRRREVEALFLERSRKPRRAPRVRVIRGGEES